MIFENTLKQLNEKNIRYLIIGGFAVVLSGYTRLTVDLDLLVDFKDDNLEKCVSTLQEQGYVSRLPVSAQSLFDECQRKKWYDEKNMRAFTFIHPAKPLEDIDILIYSPVPFEDAWNKRQKVLFTNGLVNVLSIDDLIILKQEAWNESKRPKDLYDLQALQELKK